MKYTFDKNYFEKIDTEDKSYWLGFFYADGVLYTDGYKSHHISLKLSSKDVNHILKFKKHINSNHPIKTTKSYSVFPSGHSGTYESSMLRISSVKMFNDLFSVGCIPNKSLKLEFPSEKIINKNLINHFIRGYFDGDGSISITKINNQKQFTILGTLDFLSEIQKILINKCKLTKTKIHSKGNVYCLSYAGNKNISKIKNFLYKDSITWLDRKYKIFFSQLISIYYKSKTEFCQTL